MCLGKTDKHKLLLKIIALTEFSLRMTPLALVKRKVVQTMRFSNELSLLHQRLIFTEAQQIQTPDIQLNVDNCLEGT